MNARLLVGLMTVAMLAACPKEGGAPAAGGSAAKPEAAKPSANKTYNIDGLKLAFELPSSVEVSDPLEMLGSYTYRVGGAVVQIMAVKEDSLSAAHSLDEAKKEAEMFEDVKVTKADKTADGWRVEYNHNSGTGRDFKVSIRRAFGGAEFNCEASGGDVAKVTAAAKACEAITYKGPAVPKAAAAADAPKGDEAPKADAPKADAPAAPAAGAAGASCAKAVKCCQALNGEKGPACAPLANAPEATCAASLDSFKKAVKAAMPKKAADCE